MPTSTELGDAGGGVKPEDAVDFEQSLAELEALLQRLEGETLSLDDAVALYERGIALTQRCRSALNNAEQRIRTLTETRIEDGLSVPATAADTEED